MAFPEQDIASSLRVLFYGELREDKRITIQEEREVARLTARPADLRHSLASRRTLVAPVRRLPPELLSQIFLHCLTPWSYERSLVVTAGQHLPSSAPLQLCQISRLWRHIALSTPQLWSYAVFVLSLNLKVSWARMDRLETWLRRSKEAPLTVRVNGVYSMSAPISLAKKLAEIISAHSAHLVAIEFIGSTVDIETVFAQPSIFARLQTIRISCISGTATPGRKSWTGLLPAAPHLRHLFLDLAADLVDIVSVPVLWAQLTHLNLLSVTLSAEDCMNLLSQCTALQYCDVTVSRGFPSHTRAAGLAHSSILHCLSDITIHALVDISPILSIFTFPALEKMAVSARDRNHVPLAPFCEFLRRSGRLLAQISLRGLDMPDSEFIHCLQYTPLVASLSVVRFRDDVAHHMITDKFLAALTVRPDKSALLPKLQFLVLYTESDDDGSTLVNMIRSRWHLAPTVCSPERAVSRLESCEILLDGSTVAEHISTQIDDLMYEGLDLSVV